MQHTWKKEEIHIVIDERQGRDLLEDLGVDGSIKIK
jgi:hypothetical protein